MRVLVIGAGIGGLTTAKGLLDRGHEVLVFEHAQQLRGEGAAVTLWSNGTAALRALGVPIAGLGRQLCSLQARTHRDRLLWEADLAEVSDRLGSPIIVLPRRELVHRLGAQLPAEVLHFGRRCEWIEELPDRVIAHFTDGSSETGDLVIGADGQHSVVRRGVIGPGSAKLNGWASWQGLIRTDAEVAAGHRTLNIVGKTGQCGLMPAGGGLLHWWFDLNWTPDQGHWESPVRELRRRFAGWPPEVDHVLSTITDADVGFFPHVRHRVPRVWGGPRSTLVGDAAHAMPPAVAQAANQTLEDAWALVGSLASVEMQPAGSPAETALRAYERSRRGRVAKVSRAANLTSLQRNTPLQRLGRMPNRLASWSQVASLRASSTVLRSA